MVDIINKTTSAINNFSLDPAARAIAARNASVAPTTTTKATASTSGTGYANGVPVMSTVTPGSINLTAKKTPVVSSSTVTSSIVPKAKELVETQKATNTTYQKGIADLDAQTTNQDRVMRGSGKPNPNYVPPPTPTATPKTPESALASLPEDGMQKVYDASGNETEVPIGEIPQGYFSQNPKTRSDVNNTANVDNGVQYKEFSDGTFGRFDATGNFTQVTKAAFDDAKNMEGIIQKKNDIINGVHKLSPNQQAQIDSLTSKYGELIKKYERENANLVGGTLIAQNMYGMGTTLIGRGIVSQVINDGLDKIKDVQLELAGKVASMTEAFEKDDMDLLQQAYTDYQNGQTSLQSEIDKMNTSLKEQAEKDKTAKVDTAIATLYSQGITDPIDILQELHKQGLPADSQTVGTALGVINKAVDDAEKKQQDVWNAAQAVGDYKTAAAVMSLDPRSPTFLDDLKRLQGGLKAKATEAEKSSYEISNTYNVLNNSTGSDGYVDPALFTKLRANSNLSTSDFNARYGHFVNPLSYGRVGLKEASPEFELTPTLQTELIKNGVDISAYKSDPEYRKAVNSKLE